MAMLSLQLSKMEKESEEIQMKNSQLQMKNKSLKAELEEAEQQIDESEVSILSFTSRAPDSLFIAPDKAIFQPKIVDTVKF